MPDTLQISSRINIRPFSRAEYLVAVDWWSTVEGLTLNQSDTSEVIAALFRRNPDLSMKPQTSHH